MSCRRLLGSTHVEVLSASTSDSFQFSGTEEMRMENGETDARSFVLLRCAQIASVALGTGTEKRKMGPSKGEGGPGHPGLTNIVFAE